MAVEDFDADERSLTKKNRPIGWFVAGLILVGAATTFFGYHVPLRGAHDKLVSEHKALATKAGELDHSLKADRALLDVTASRRDQLERFVDVGVSEVASRAVELELLKTTVQRELAAFEKSKLLQITTKEDTLELRFAEQAFFRPKTSALLPQAHGGLCKVVGALTAFESWDIEVVAEADGADKKYWKSATERASALAQVLEEQCKFSPDSLRASAVRKANAEGTSVAVTLALIQRAPKKFSLADSPKTETTPAKP